MKKRLFITTALMTAVLGCSLTTGTYAWYVATAGTFNSASKSAEITTAGSGFAVGELTFTVSLTNSGNPDLVDSTGATKYFTAGGIGEAGSGLTTSTETNVKFGTLTLGVTATNAEGETASKNELISIQGSYNIAFSSDYAPTEGIKYSTTQTPWSNGAVNSFTSVMTISSGGEISIDHTTIYYSIMADEDTVQDPDVKVTITATLSNVKNS